MASFKLIPVNIPALSLEDRVVGWNQPGAVLETIQKYGNFPASELIHICKNIGTLLPGQHLIQELPAIERPGYTLRNAYIVIVRL